TAAGAPGVVPRPAQPLGARAPESGPPWLRRQPAHAGRRGPGHPGPPPLRATAGHAAAHPYAGGAGTQDAGLASAPSRRRDRGDRTMTVQQFEESVPATNELAHVRVFLLDDHEIVRRGIADLLEAASEISVVGEAGTAAEALRRIPAARPDVAVLDARLPDGSGIDVCRDIRSSHPEIHCLILTSYDDNDAIFAAVMAGASGYLLKQIRGSSLVDGVRDVAAGESLLHPNVTQPLLEPLPES